MYVKVSGLWRYVYRAIDQYGQVIDVYVSVRRDTHAARRFFADALAATRITPVEVATDRAAVYPAVLEELLPMAHHNTERYRNNRIESDHGRLKHRLRPMRGLKTDQGARTAITGYAFVQNVRRGFYELAVEEPAGSRVAVAFTELARAVSADHAPGVGVDDRRAVHRAVRGGVFGDVGEPQAVPCGQVNTRWTRSSSVAVLTGSRRCLRR